MWLSLAKQQLEIFHESVSQFHQYLFQRSSSFFLLIYSPWYNRNGWLGVKHPSYLLTFCLEVELFYWWRVEKGWLVMYLILLPSMPALLVVSLIQTAGNRWQRSQLCFCHCFWQGLGGLLPSAPWARCMVAAGTYQQCTKHCPLCQLVFSVASVLC